MTRSRRSPKPLDEIVWRLAACVRRDSSGAKSLAHVLVAVPTAQSGRRLRQRLAAHFGAIIPPEILMPIQFFAQKGEVEIAGRTDELRAFCEAMGASATLDAAVQLSDIRRILGANALTFADVAAQVGNVLSDELADFEIARWQELAETERRYFAALERRGKTDRIQAMKEALEEPPRQEGIECIFLACLLDPLPAFRRLLARLAARDGIVVEEIVPSALSAPPVPPPLTQIVPCATAASEASRVADVFASVAQTEALPALCVADPESFPEIQGAMLAKGLKVHNPTQTPLVTSSLGHLVEQIAALVQTHSYSVFSAFVRSGDVRRWLCEELKITPAEYVAALTNLDNRQAELLPEKIDDIRQKTKGCLRAIFEHVDATLRKKGIRQILQAVFRGYRLDERDPDAREFAAAAECVRELIGECYPAHADASPADIRFATDLFIRRLGETAYSLEPDEGEVVLADGWLEIPFLDADELIVTGFNEGCVPESVVGHAFLPDRLRRGLGLPDNVARAKRDREILQLALACREWNAVRIFFRAIDAQGDVLKPSRLLFDNVDDRDLVERVKAFYQVKAGTEETPSADLPAGWRLKLDIPPARATLAFTSPSSLDLYLRCPFTYCLKKTFGEREDDRAEELDPSEFGNLVHDALQRWGMGELKDSEDSAAIAAELAQYIDTILSERFGLSVPAIVSLQGESAKRRLAAFADIQSERHRQGWRTVAAERKLQVVYGHTTVKGRCDRIDRNVVTGEWCVVDYKTFDNPERALWIDPKSKEWKSLQLPLYCAMLDADPDFPEARRENISSVYCVLGKRPEETLFTMPMNGAFVPEAEEKVRELIDRIECGLFWPPSPADEWRMDFAQWIFNKPEDSVDSAWLADQLARCAAEEGEKPA